MKIAKLISLVKDQPILYDSLNPMNKDRNEKDKIWREISSAMNIHIDVVKSRWKSLKDCYTKYLKSTMATGSKTYIKYINWQWAEQMEFMKPHIKFGLIITNIELQDNQETIELGTHSNLNVQSYQFDSEVLGTHDRCGTSERSVTSDRSEIEERSGAYEQSNRRSHFADRSGKQEKSFRKVRRRRRAVMASPDHNNSNTDRIIQYLENKKIHTRNYSATELILLGYAKSIKTFSVRRQAQVKMKIAQIMMEEEIAHFEESSKQSHSDYSHHNF